MPGQGQIEEASQSKRRHGVAAEGGVSGDALHGRVVQGRVLPAQSDDGRPAHQGTQSFAAKAACREAHERIHGVAGARA